MKIGNFQEPSISPTQAKGDILYWYPHESASASMDANTLLLCHFDTAKASSVLAATGQTITYYAGADCVNTQSKFGGKSLACSRSGAAYATIPANAAWNDPGTASFTWDCWVHPTEMTYRNQIMGLNGTSPNRFYNTYINPDGTMLSSGYDTDQEQVFEISADSDFNIDTWSHFAWVRNGNVTKFYQDGHSLTLSGSLLTTQAMPTTIQAMHIGKIGTYSSGNDDFFSGYIDEFRWSNIARWTTDFGGVAPTAYADSDVSSGVKTKVTAPINDLIEGASVTIAGTTGAAYDGTFTISNVTGTTFDIPVVFGSNPAAKGTWSSLPGVAYPYLPAGGPGGSTANPAVIGGWKVLPIGGAGAVLKVSSAGIIEWV